MRLPITIALLLPLGAAAETFVPPERLSPADDWCGSVNDQSGPLLGPGTYEGPCAITTDGARLEAGPEGGVTVSYDGDSSNVIDVLASDVSITGVRFETTQPGVDAIKIKSGDRTRVTNCTFVGIGGISISANSADSESTFIHSNRFEGLKATAIYLGCHEGAGECAARSVTVANNAIVGVQSDSVGYGIQLKMDSDGKILDNVIADTKGPGIMVYGSTLDGATIEVSRNFVFESATAAGIEVGGGPALITNNIVFGGPEGGIYSYDYQDRGLVDGIRITANSVVGDGGSAIRLSSDWVAGKDLSLVANAVWQRSGAVAALPAEISGLVIHDNIDCEDPEQCWVDAQARDLYPAVASPLLAGYTAVAPADKMAVDWCNRARTPPLTIGAMQTSDVGGPGPIPLDFKVACPHESPPVELPPDEEPGVAEPAPDSDASAAGPEAGGDAATSRSDGGCSQGGRPSPGWIWPTLCLAVLVFVRRADARLAIRRT